MTEQWIIKKQSWAWEKLRKLCDGLMDEIEGRCETSRFYGGGYEDTAPCSLAEVDRRFRGAYCLRHHRSDDRGSMSSSMSNVVGQRGSERTDHTGRYTTSGYEDGTCGSMRTEKQTHKEDWRHATSVLRLGCPFVQSILHLDVLFFTSLKKEIEAYKAFTSSLCPSVWVPPLINNFWTNWYICIKLSMEVMTFKMASTPYFLIP
jgi:hypothetical protein